MRALTRGLLAAMLLAMLAPAISRGVASTRVAGDWVELCSAQGTHWIQLTAWGEEAAPVSASDLLHALDNCGHCALTAERFAPLLPSFPALPPSMGVWGVPQHRAAMQLCLDAPSPGARDPPLLS